MTSPQGFFEGQEEFASGNSFEEFKKLWNEVLRAGTNEDMHDFKGFPFKEIGSSSFQENFSQGEFHVSCKDGMTIFDTPYNVILDSVNVASTMFYLHF